ncbi:MAG TPA: tetratricopeptide repeat protein [Candidatus Sulfotelmatobacter sp.]|nr:tetratricopeptide repeat protein [Candidatus Sulfotelmatobacter sp.]
MHLRRIESGRAKPQRAIPSDEESPGEIRLQISGWKKWALRGALAVLTPCLLLALLEGGLRLFGFGYRSSYFLKKRVDGRTFFIENPKFELRFFPPALLRLPSSLTVPSSKAPGTYRIFVIGSSAAAGFPEPAYSFPRILEVILKAKYPEKHFEVINTATTAINSNVDLPIVEDAAKHQPDLFVVYEGHNEVLGPFGPGTVFVPYSGSLKAIRSTIFIKSTKIGQLLDSLHFLLVKGKVPSEWRGMEMVAKNQLRRDDPRLPVVYSHFQSNLTDICHAASRGGARVILATLGTNLKDAAPFASLHRADLSPDQLTQWEALYQQGIKAESERNFAQALDSYLSAAKIDDQFADLQFRLARSYGRLQKYASASQHYIQARDDDALRFRADSAINQIIRDVAAAQESNRVALVDIEKLLQTTPAATIPGAELFYDHVHLNFSGNYLVAKTISEQVDLILSGSARIAVSQEECARQLAFTDWNRASIAKDLLPQLQDVPFINQLNHDEQMATLKQQMATLFAKGTAQIVAAARSAYERALQLAPDDWMLHNQYGILLADSGDSPAAIEQFRKVLRLVPYRSWPHVALAQALAKSNRSEAQQEFQEALRLDPYSPNAHLGLGRLCMEEGSSEQALSQYQAVLQESPQNAKALVGVGNVWATQRNNAEATDAYERALQASPSLAEAHYHLGELLMREGSTEQAVSYLSRAIQLDFAYADAHVKLGEAYEAESRPEDAIEEYLTAAAVDPSQLQRYYSLVADLLNRNGRHGAAELALGDAYSAQHKWSEAAGHYSEAVKTNPEVAEFHLQFATALNQLGRNQQARAELATAMRLNPRLAGKTAIEPTKK